MCIICNVCLTVNLLTRSAVSTSSVLLGLVSSCHVSVESVERGDSGNENTLVSLIEELWTLSNKASLPHDGT